MKIMKLWFDQRVLMLYNLSHHLTHCPSWPNTHVSLDYLLFQILALISMKDILRYPNERNDPGGTDLVPDLICPTTYLNTFLGCLYLFAQFHIIKMITEKCKDMQKAKQSGEDKDIVLTLVLESFCGFFKVS